MFTLGKRFDRCSAPSAAVLFALCFSPSAILDDLLFRPFLYRNQCCSPGLALTQSRFSFVCDINHDSPGILSPRLASFLDLGRLLSFWMNQICTTRSAILLKPTH